MSLFKIARSLARMKGWELSKRLQEEAIRNLLSERHVDLVVDCGANVGEFGSQLRKRGYKGRILSIEPSTSAFVKLANRSLRDPEWDAHKGALGSEAAKLSLNIGSHGEGELSSFYQSAKSVLPIDFAGTELVNVVRFDQLLDDLDVEDDRHIFLKVDTQGHDLEVMRGVGDRLKQVVGFMTEMSVQPIYEGTPSHWQMLEFAREAGFEPIAFMPISMDRAQRIIEYDAVFARSVS